MPIPKSPDTCQYLIEQVRKNLDDRVRGKAFIKMSPQLIEKALSTSSMRPINDFLSLGEEEIIESTSNRTVTSEFGGFESFRLSSENVRRNILLPKYYAPSIELELKELEKTCEVIPLSNLRESGIVEYSTGDEIGKMAYGTGSIPFIRTSDFANWEIKHNPKKGVSQEIYEQYASSQDVQENDILLVRDGTYLIGTSCLITEYDAKSLFCGGLYKIRVNPNELITPFLLLGLLNSFIVKRQIRTKQFTRDVIDTIGHRLDEVFIPIPKSVELRNTLSQEIYKVISTRINARKTISKLTTQIDSHKLF